MFFQVELICRNILNFIVFFWRLRCWSAPKWQTKRNLFEQQRWSWFIAVFPPSFLLLFSVTLYTYSNRKINESASSCSCIAVGCVQLHGSVDDEMKYNDDILFLHYHQVIFILLNEWFMYKYVIFQKRKSIILFCGEVSCRYKKGCLWWMFCHNSRA